MSETAVIKVDRCEAADGKKPFKLFDGNGRDYATFDTTRGTEAMAFVGKQAKITFSEKPSKDGRFTNRYLDAIEEIPTDEEHALGDGTYVKGKENPSTQRSIHASVALQQAVATLTHTVGMNATPKEVSERILPLASEYFRWLLQRTGLETDEDIPF